jgi:ligand-binding sensor domain-containing protein
MKRSDLLMNRTSLALTFCLLPLVVLAQPFTWTSFTSTSNVVDMVVSGSEIWTATSGGLAGYNPATGKFNLYTNTRGLAMNQCVAVGKDDRGFIWAGVGDARITRINPQTGEVRQIVDLANDVFEINEILDVGDEVFVAANNGIYRFAYYRTVDNYRVLEPIKVLGTFPGESGVTSLAVAGGYLYAGTVAGLARAPLSESQLNAPGVWENFTRANSPLPENSIVALHGYDGSELDIATPNWAVHLADTVWTTQQIAGITHFSGGTNPAIRYAVSDVQSQVLAAESPQWQWHPVGEGLPSRMTIDVITVGGVAQMVVGEGDNNSGSGGLVFSSAPGNVPWSAAISAPGIGGNFITALAVDPQGKLWAGGQGFTSGVYVRQGEEWLNFDRSAGYNQAFFAAHPTSFAFDDRGGTWVGSMGNGLAWFRSLDSITYFDNFGDTDGYANVGGVLTPRLTGITTDPANGLYYIETYVARDPSGDICITNLEVWNSMALTVAPAAWIAQGNNPAPWQYFEPTTTPYLSSFRYTGRVLADALGRIWLGPGRNGTYIYVLDPRGTLTDSLDDNWAVFTPDGRRDLTTCFETITPEVLTWAVDGQGYLWAGTINGAYYTQGGVAADANATHFICVADLPVGRRVNAIHVDSQDNKWFGTDDGVAVLDKNFNWIYVFQTASSVDHPSGLISNNVLAISSNPSTGEVWIGTSDGLSRFTSPIVSTDPSLSKIWPYPNPFRADGTQHMRIDPVRLGGHFDDMRILTISGRLVRKLTWEQMTDPGSGGGWDGRNEEKNLVSGGVYLLVVSTSDGQSATGKVAVLGK